jgi:hypothetical protein
MSIETEDDTLWLWALINCHLPLPAPTQSLIIKGTCIGTANFLTENSLVTTPFYILLNKSATLLDIAFKRRKFHCCNNQKIIIFTSVCIFLEWYNCCQKKKIYTSKKPT